MALTAERTDEVIRTALDEDIGDGDVTTDSIVPVDTRCRAVLLLEEPGIACGVRIARAVFQALEPTIRVDALVKDGAHGEQTPAAIVEINGPARAILTGERTALNLVARLCGIASLTRQYVDRVEGTAAVIRDTRKTTPGLRRLEKYAVRCGGGCKSR